MKNMYIVAIDYRASYKPMTTDYKVLEAENLLDAMNEAESYLDKEKVYLLNIMQATKAPRKVKGMPFFKAGSYTDILINRGYGWHNADAAHSETTWKHTMQIDTTSNDVWLIDCVEAV